jgi:hypothetical protein
MNGPSLPPSGRNRPPGLLLGRQALSHVGYVVDDIEAAASEWQRTFSVGPFLLLDNIAFDEVSYLGEPCTWEHSAAFASWGEVLVELQQHHRIEPPALAEMLTAVSGPRTNHFSFVSSTPERDSEYLEAQGHPRFLFARDGDIELRFHFIPSLRHSVEIHRACPALEGFFRQVREAAIGWDGRDPIRPPEAP